MDVIIKEGNLLPKKLSASTILGAIIGDYVGSRYEFNNHRSKDFEFFDNECRFTDDTVLTLAVYSAIKLYKKDDSHSLEDYLVNEFNKFVSLYPYAGYGGRFNKWISSKNKKPYRSMGNGAAMRISPAAYFAENRKELNALSLKITRITHNSMQGLLASECISLLSYLALSGHTKDELRGVARKYYYIDFRLDDIREYYEFDELCDGSVPEAIVAFLEGDNFEDCIRNAISIGGDSDTIACITGTLAGAYYSIPEKFIIHIKNILQNDYPFLYETIKDLLN